MLQKRTPENSYIAEKSSKKKTEEKHSHEDLETKVSLPTRSTFCTDNVPSINSAFIEVGVKVNRMIACS